MFEFIIRVTPGDLSLLLISGYLLYQLVQTAIEKVNSACNLTKKFGNDVSVLAVNSSIIARSVDSAADNLNAISHVASQLTQVIDTNNWRNNMMELVKAYIPLLTQVLFPSHTPTVRPTPCNFGDNMFGNLRCNRNNYGNTGPTGHTGPTGPIYADLANPINVRVESSPQTCPDIITDIKIEAPPQTNEENDAVIPTKLARANQLNSGLPNPLVTIDTESESE